MFLLNFFSVNKLLRNLESKFSRAGLIRVVIREREIEQSIDTVCSSLHSCQMYSTGSMGVNSRVVPDHPLGLRYTENTCHSI